MIEEFKKDKKWNGIQFKKKLGQNTGRNQSQNKEGISPREL